jgi:AraC-like DNA-binding protein
MGDRRFRATSPDAAANVGGDRRGTLGFVVERISMGEGSPLNVFGVAGARLVGHVRGYRGYENTSSGSARLRVVPSTQLNLDISFGAPPRFTDSDAAPVAAVYGLRTQAVALRRAEGQGVLVELSPHGAYALLGLPLWELTDTVVDLADVLGRGAEQTVARLAETPGWQRRLALLDDALAARVEAGPRPAPQVVWAWQRLRRSNGRIPIARLAAEVGWTRQYLATRFREQIGLAPKRAARVIRFQHALQLLQQPSRPSLSRVALVTGYSDQAHLTREVRAFTGATPAELTAWPRYARDGAPPTAGPRR